MDAASQTVCSHFMMTVKAKPITKADMISSERVVDSVWTRAWKRRSTLELKTWSRAFEVKVKKARLAPVWKDLIVQVEEAVWTEMMHFSLSQ